MRRITAGSGLDGISEEAQMHISRMLPVCLLAGLLMVLAGCSGGGNSLAGSGTVSGSVLLPGEAMIRDGGDMTVGIDGTELATRPAADGSFRLTGVPPGTQTLYVISGDGYLARSVVAIVEEGRETNVGNLELVNAGWIAGMITSTATGQPIAGARVTVINDLAAEAVAILPCPIRVTNTAADGTYTVRGLPEGAYAVTIEKRDFAPVSLVIDVFAGRTTLGDAALTPISLLEGSMAGTVYSITDSGETTPLAGALVCLSPLGDFIPGPMPVETRPGEMPPASRVYYTFSDTNGWYQLDGVPAGDYLAIAQRPGFDPDSYEVTIGDATIAQDFKLRPHPIEIGVVVGTVTDNETGLPIAGALISAVNDPTPVDTTMNTGSVVGPDGDIYRMYAVTDEQGYYELKAPVSVNAIGARASGYQPQTQPVVIIPEGTVTVDFTLAPATDERFTLSGRVGTKSEDGTIVPVADATVYAAPYSTDPTIMMPVIIYSAQTDAEGYYKMLLPAWGTYRVYAVKGNLQSEQVTITMLGDVVRNFQLRPLVGL